MTDFRLVLENVVIRRGDQVLLCVDRAIDPGEVLTLMGPSGSGKSTLLSAITGTLSRDFRLSGDIRLRGQSVLKLPRHDRHIGILFQDDLLFPHLSVGANLLYGLPPKRKNRQDIAKTALAQIGLAGFYSRDPATLSGGQKARVALMRMLLSEPYALLLDEPFSGLDTELRGQIRALVFEQAKQRQMPVLLVTHDIEDAQAANGPIHRLS